jgi:hypothetical protein
MQHHSGFIDNTDVASTASAEDGDYFTCRVGNVKVLLDLLACLVSDTSKDHQSDIIASSEGKIHSFFMDINYNLWTF